ncbi:MAG TPA: hypothetical protein VF692_08160 [Pyrinomonadaceae bacterium]
MLKKLFAWLNRKPPEENKPEDGATNKRAEKPEIDRRIFDLSDKYDFCTAMRPGEDSPSLNAAEVIRQIADAACEGRIHLIKQFGIKPKFAMTSEKVVVHNRVLIVSTKISFVDHDENTFSGGLCPHEKERLKDLDLYLKSLLN